MNTHEQKKLSESLLAACKAAGIEKPKYIAQDEDGQVWHYYTNPKMFTTCFSDYGESSSIIDHPPYADDWQDSLLEFRDYALIRTCDKCKAITAIDMVGSDENEKELQYDGETVFRVSKEEAHGAVIKLCKCACGVENFNITKAAAMAKWRESFEFTETEKQQIDALADEPIKTLAGKSKEWFEQSAIIEGDSEVGAGLAHLQGELLANILARHPEHVADTSKMVDPYKVQVGGVTLDPYMIASIYGINDPIIFQMLKKLLRFGRKHKDAAQDVVDTITSAIRWLEINAPERAKALIEAITEKGETK